jgi:putative transposase
MPCALRWSILPKTGEGIFVPLAGPTRADPKLWSPWPLPRLHNWVNRVNEPLKEKEIQAVRWSLKRGSPFGDETWVESTARRLDLESTLRPRGRPRVRQLPRKES